LGSIYWVDGVGWILSGSLGVKNLNEPKDEDYFGGV